MALEVAEEGEERVELEGALTEELRQRLHLPRALFGAGSGVRFSLDPTQGAPLVLEVIGSASRLSMHFDRLRFLDRFVFSDGTFTYEPSRAEDWQRP